ncbi:glycosyltransferase WbuB [Chryseobacterium sp. G0186]|uniref:glycosyltransferase family 4 protein n=1 Tax=Chryseobacterium sp. G0186 TaxID=2487064 RepID=UPI000F4E60C6|nr:glycosyltransferase family 4 protein [Chryseobacterium sp. G0186]AZA77666.1 glycosyltransferase WbuB [Chryseobacterium sp. G0186]
MEKIWIATELFFPEETSTSFILTKVVNKLSSKYQVNVICGEPVYDSGENKNENFSLDSRVKVSRIKGFANNKNSLIERTFRFIFLSLLIFYKLLINVKKGEKIFIVTNPAPLVILAVLVKIIKRSQLIILVHDVFPENTIPAGIVKSESSVIYRLLKNIFDKAYSKADLLIVLGRDMKEVIQSKIKKTKAKIVIIENWGDVDQIIPVSKNEVLALNSELQDKVVIQYAGNIGRVQGLMSFLEAVKKVTNEKVAYYFVGEGAVKNEMKDYVQTHGLKNISFAGAYSRADQQKVLNQTDIALVTLADGMFGLGVPSKVYNILAAGKPILFIGDLRSEVSLLIKEYNIGYVFASHKEPGLVDFLNSIDERFLKDLEEKSRNARILAETKFSEEAILNKFYEII